MKEIPTYEINRRHLQWAWVLMLAGITAIIIGFFIDPTRVWANLLINNYYITSLGLFGIVFLALTYITKGHWAVPVKRVSEAMMANLPIAFIIMIILCFGMPSLYHWTHTEAVLKDSILQHKQPYLNTTFFIIRMVIFFSVWIFFASWFRKNSLRQDKDPNLVYHRRNIRFSAAFMVCFAVTFSFASYDWLMSLEPHWYSTMFSFYTFTSLLLHGAAVMTLVTVYLVERGYLSNFVNENHLHDLGKMMFAFSTLWGYIWYSQFLLIWYANIPEESIYYYVRMDRDWKWLFFLSLILNWLVPFVVLMSRKAKRSPAILKRVAITLMIGYWIDLYVQVAPAVIETRQIGLIEIFIALGFAAVFFCVTGRALSKAPLIARNDPNIQESLNFHQ